MKTKANPTYLKRVSSEFTLYNRKRNSILRWVGYEQKQKIILDSTHTRDYIYFIPIAFRIGRIYWRLEMKDHSQEELTIKNDTATARPWIKKIGILLVILSCVLYGGLLIVPFTPYTAGTKAVISTALIVSGEASFWFGALILGKELVTRYRKHLNPFRWFKKRNN